MDGVKFYLWKLLVFIQKKSVSNNMSDKDIIFWLNTSKCFISHENFPLSLLPTSQQEETVGILELSGRRKQLETKPKKATSLIVFSCFTGSVTFLHQTPPF